MDLTTLGIKVTTDGVQQASQQLDKLADAGDKAAASAEKMAPAVKKAGSALKEYPASAYRRDMESLIGSYSKTEEKLKEVATQQKRWNELHKSGTINTAEYDAYVGQLEKVSNALGLQTSANSKAALSAKQLAQANRQLPMQFTDIAVSLQAGQRPFTVLLQQGSQIKDMYGGIGPALKAVASYAIGMVNPLTLAAAALAGLVAAYKSGADEQFRFANALIQTGGYATTSSSQLKVLVSELEKLEGVSYGGASNALLAVAQSGRFAGDQFRIVAEAAARMEATTGQAIDETISKFADLAKDPVNALLKLNETEHFLTQTQLDRVQALIDEGKFTDAASEATRIYADRLNDVADASEAAMPHLTRTWRDVKDSISAAWNEAKGFAEFMAAASVQFNERPWWQRFGPAGAINAVRGMYSAQPAAPARIPTVSGAIDNARRREEEEERKRTKALEEWASTADRAAQRQQTLNKLRDEGRKLGASESEIEAVLNRQRAEWAAQDAKSTGSRRRRREEKTEEQKATEALIKAYESLNTQMDRRLFILSNGNDEAAALAYDFERGALSKMNDELARTLTYLDAMGQVRNFEGVADMRERMTNSIRAIEAEEDFDAIYGGLDRIASKTKDTKDAMTAFADQAARNMQSSFADFLFNPFEDGIGGMVKGFSDSLRRMAAELAASKVFELLANWATGYGGTGSNWINALGNSIKGGKGFAEGGYTGAGGVYDPAGIVHKGEVVWSQRDVSRAGGVGVVEAMRLGLRGYASGGVVGGPSGRIVGGGQPSVAVNIQNNTGSQMDTSEQSVNFDGEKWVVNIVAKAIGSGRLDRTMGSAFGVRRQGYSGG